MRLGRMSIRIIGVLIALAFAVCAGAQAPHCDIITGVENEAPCEPALKFGLNLSWSPVWQDCVPGGGKCNYMTTFDGEGGEHGDRD